MDEKMLLQAISQMMDTKLKPVNEKLEAIENRTLKLEVTLENETNRNIKLLMEGHSQVVADIKEIKTKVNKIDDIENRLFATEVVTKENRHNIKVLQAQAK